MTKLQMTVLVGVAAAGVILGYHFHHRTQVQLRETEARINSDAETLREVIVENKRLSNRLVNATDDAASNRLNELNSLQATAAALKRQTNELAQKLPKSGSLRPDQAEPPHPQRPPEYFQQVHQMAGSKPQEAMRLAAAFLAYTSDHDGHAPANIEQLIQNLDQGEAPLSGTNHFEIVYQGSMRDLQGIPGGAIAVLRDGATWIGPEGKPLRVYGMGDGSGQIVGADESVESWEARHIIASKPK